MTPKTSVVAGDIPDNMEGFDIGPKTAALYADDQGGQDDCVEWADGRV